MRRTPVTANRERNFGDEEQAAIEVRRGPGSRAASHAGGRPARTANPCGGHRGRVPRCRRLLGRSSGAPHDPARVPAPLAESQWVTGVYELTLAGFLMVS